MATVTVQVTETAAVNPNAGLVAGGVVAGVVFGVAVALLAVLAVWWFLRKRRANSGSTAVQQQQQQPELDGHGLRSQNSSWRETYGRHELPRASEVQRGELAAE
jgi:hypothetical protein